LAAATCAPASLRSFYDRGWRQGEYFNLTDSPILDLI
jgi:hypothetical protein